MVRGDEQCICYIEREDTVLFPDLHSSKLTKLNGKSFEMHLFSTRMELFCFDMHFEFYPDLGCVCD